MQCFKFSNAFACPCLEFSIKSEDTSTILKDKDADKWIYAKVFALFKKGDRSVYGNDIGMPLLLVVAKSISQSFYKIITETQNAFRYGICTVEITMLFPLRQFQQ